MARRGAGGAASICRRFPFLRRHAFPIIATFSSSSADPSPADGLHDSSNIAHQTKCPVSVFWDLDNKPPPSVPPYDAAIRLREVALGFGRLVDMVAYANRHAFSYLPSWVQEQRRYRRQLDLLEIQGLHLPPQPYVCGYCGRKCKTRIALRAHFKQLHEREREKRLRRLDSLKGKRKLKYKQSLIEKETRYREASQDLLTPKVGYGLMQELKRAGVLVRMVSDQPQAADEALKRHICESIHGQGIRCMCLVSDDSDFLPTLKDARNQRIHTVVIGDTRALNRYADVQFSWADIATGRAFDRATELAISWYGKEKSCRGPCSSMNIDADPTTYFGNYRSFDDANASALPLRSHDFKDWDVSDDESEQVEYSIVEANANDVESEESSGIGWLLSDDEEDCDDET